MKLTLYARSGIPEVWIVNLAAEVVEVYRDPGGDAYASVTRAGKAEVLTIAALPGVSISVAPLFA